MNPRLYGSGKKCHDLRPTKLKTKALRARYQELFGEETRSWNQAHLYRRMAWRLQAQALGGLSTSAETGRRTGGRSLAAAAGCAAVLARGRFGRASSCSR